MSALDLLLPSKRTAQRVGAFAFTVLLVTGAFGGAMGGMFGPSVEDAAETASPVGESEALVPAVVAGAALGYAAYDYLDAEDKEQQAINEAMDEVQQANANETKAEIHSTAGQLRASNEQFLAILSNYNSDSDTVAFSKGEAAAVEALANGATVAEAQQAANESIADYYTTKQMNLVDRYNLGVESVMTMREKAGNTTGVNSTFVRPTDTQESGHPDDDEILASSGTTTSHTLLNGSQTLVSQFETKFYVGSSGGTAGISSETFTVSFADFIGTEEATYTVTDIYDAYWDGQVIVEPTADLLSRTAMDFSEFGSAYSDIQTNAQTQQAEVSTYVNDSLGPAYESGDLNATSYVSPSTLSQEYATEYGNTTGYVQATATAAYMGYSTPDLDSTASMTISYNGSEHTGMLMSQNSPEGGSWQAGESYDASLIGGKQFFAIANAESGEESMIELTGSFTIDSIEGTGGAEIESAETEQITYETTNASANYSALQDQIGDLRIAVEEATQRASGGGGGSSGGPNLSEQQMLILALLVGGAAVVSVFGGRS